MHKKAMPHQLDKTLMIKVADLPSGDVQLGHVHGSSDPVLFDRNGPVHYGRLTLAFSELTAADQALLDAAPAGTVFGLAVDIKDADGDLIYAAAANSKPSADVGQAALPNALAFPSDELQYQLAEITVNDPLGLDGLYVAWIPEG